MKIVYPEGVGAFVTEEDLLAFLAQGESILVPAARAARSLRLNFDAEQRRRGRPAWESPRVLSWTEWIAGLWTQLVTRGAESRLLLNSAQEHSLWLEVITEHSGSALSVETVESLARLARSAWQLCGHWELGRRLRAAASTHDSRTFADWSEDFARRCAERGYLSAAFLEGALVQHVQAGQLDLPPRLRLVNFEEWTSAQGRFLAVLRKSGRVLDEVFTRAVQARTQSMPARLLAIAANEREELVSAARWARAQALSQALSQAQAGQGLPRPVRIGLLLPEKGVDLAELESVFREVLAPELQPVQADLSCTPWEIAAGEPLAAVPLVSTALDLIRWCAGPLALPKASALLLSPYTAGFADPDWNARFDARWLRSRNRLRPEITLRAAAFLGAAAAREAHEAAPAWLSALDDLSAKADPKLRRSFSEWMEVVRQLLKAAGWPGERALSAREQAAVRAWEDTLDQVATLDFAGHRIPFLDAVKAAERQASTNLFQPGSGDAPVTVLSLKEAAGSSWEALLLLRGTEMHWPPSASPHPLLGAGLQRELRMPGAFPEREVAAVEALLSRTSNSSATCAAENGDGPLRPAPFLQQLGFVTVAAETVLPKIPPRLECSEELVPDEAGLPPLPSPEVQGGARVLQLQAACGFLAFAAIRLGATEVEAREAGFDARESGTLLHRSLEHFWNRIRSQEALRALSFEERNRVLAECIEDAISTGLQVESSWDRAYLDLQKERLRTVLGLWLNRELKRSPFTVAESEQGSLVPVGPLTLRVRVDRVDQVEGGVVLVDYKSGYSADPKDWLGERPDQPQLPLYSLLHTPEEVRAVTFAHVRAGKDMRWNGLEAQPGILPKATTLTKVDLAQQMEEWRSTLTQLATDFSEGQSAVSPKSFTENCKRCAQRLLCRLDPASLHADQLTEEEQTVEEAYG